ncbi:Disorganized muscle protein 1 [Armadillidium vulgare]|nr:Disorganized muscle protein 1 [Armadillidium vulgare]
MGSLQGENFAPSFTKKPKLRQEDDGNKLVFDCQLSSSPKPDIAWFRGDVPVTESPRISITVKPSKTKNTYDVQLILDDVEEEDEGLYKVKAKNKFGEVAASINLNFSPQDETPSEKQIDGKAPSFAQKPIIKQEEDGKKIKFECRILADPKPTISWYRDGASVQSSSRCSMTVKNDGENSYLCVLSLSQVTLEDAGKYKVTGKNELGESNATISLNFDSSFMKNTGDESPDIPEGLKPAFTERPKIRQSDDLSSVIFSCRCAGRPKPTFRWEFKGKKMATTTRHKIKTMEEGKIYYIIEMEILKVSAADEGEYKLIASNDMGEGVATINLNFDGKTATDKPKILMVLLQDFQRNLSFVKTETS